MEKIHKQRLFEIAVAIIISGLVITTSVVWFTDLKKSARDERRESDIKQIQKELLSYFSENKEYPKTKELYNAVSLLPKDPADAEYSYENTGVDSYILGTCLEVPRSTEMQSYSRADAENYEITGASNSCTCASINAYCINQDL